MDLRPVHSPTLQESKASIFLVSPANETEVAHCLWSCTVRPNLGGTMALTALTTLTAAAQSVANVFAKKELNKHISETVGGERKSFTINGASTTKSVRTLPIAHMHDIAKEVRGSPVDVKGELKLESQGASTLVALTGEVKRRIPSQGETITSAGRAGHWPRIGLAGNARSATAENRQLSCPAPQPPSDTRY